MKNKSAMKLNLLNVVSTEYDLDLISHFEEYYSKYDIDEWHIILHGKNKEHIKKGYEKFNKEVNFYTWEDTFLSSVKIGKFNKILSSLEGNILLADIDEFHEFDKEPKGLLENDEIIVTILKDRFDKNFQVKKIVEDVNIFLQYPIENDFSFENFGSWNFKPALFNSKYRLLNSHQLCLGNHLVNYTNRPKINTAHFKWTDTRKNKSIERYTQYLNASQNGHAVNYEETQLLLKKVYNIAI